MSKPKGPLYLKLAIVGLSVSLGGPALLYYVTPAEGEIRQRFNPGLKAINDSNRERRAQNHERFINRLKEYGRDERPIWVVAEEAAEEEAAERRKTKQVMMEREGWRNQGKGGSGEG